MNSELSLSMNSVASSTTSDLSLIPEVEDPQYLDDPFSSPRLAAIFSTGIVVQENRITRTTVESEPTVFTKSILSNFEDVEQNMASTSQQKDFVAEKVANKSNFTCATYKISDKKISVLSQIKESIVKGNKTITFMNEKFRLPAIIDKRLTEVETGMRLYVDELLDTLVATNTLLQQPIARQATKQNLFNKISSYGSRLTQNRTRARVYNLFLAAQILEKLLFESTRHLIPLLKTTTLVNASDNSGAFLRLNEPPIVDKQSSMLSSATLGSAVDIVYNLRLTQIKNLVNYIFTQDVCLQMESKINLLSSVSLDIRNDIVLNPSQILLRAMKEHHLTRLEILNLIFTSLSLTPKMDMYKRCPHCTTTVQILDNSICHKICPVTQWLISNCQFEKSQNGISAPHYMYLTQGLANYTHELLSVNSKIRNKPLIARSEHEFKVFETNASGIPVITTHIGSKPVRLEQTSHYNLRR